MALIKRSEKGVSLTYTEMDANFTHLGGDGSYEFPATDGTATHVLATDGNGQLSFVPQTGADGVGIALTDLSVTTGSASGSGSLSYNSTTGAFTFAPPDLSTYLTTVAFSDLTGKPTTISGYGITDAFDGAFGSLTATPTTISGYGITDAFDGAFSSLTGKPTTVSGYGITDAFDGATSSLTGDIDLTSQVTGILPVGNMAATALTTVQTAANESAQLALTTEEGDVVVRSDEAKTYMHNGGSAGTMADYTLLATPTDSVTSVDGNTGVVTTLQLGTTATTALAGDTALLQLGTTSTTALAGDTSLLQLGTTGTTALAGNTTFTFADITSKPTTIAGYGITDSIVTSDSSIDAQPIRQLYTNQAAFPAAGTWHGALAHSHSDGAMFFAHGGSWVQLANDSDIPTVPSTVSSFTNDSNYLTTVAFADLTGKPTTISGYGITDALELGTSSTTALAGDTVVDNLLLEVAKSSASLNIGDKSWIKVATVTIDARYQYYSAQLAVVGTGAAEGVANEKVVAIRVKQQASLSNAPLVEVTTYNNSNEDYDFGHVVAVNTVNETRVDIYFRADGPNSGAEIYRMAETVTATVAWVTGFTANYVTSAPTNFVQGGVHEKWHSGNQAGIFGSTNGILKANGSGVLSAAVAGTDYSTLALGTSSTTAMAGDTTFAFSDITSTPTTISGYGITDALQLGTTSTTALAGNTTFAFSDITSTPTTISGYGITDAFDGATSSLTGNIDLASQVTGTLPVGNMAATALTTVQTASSESAQLALTAEEGDVVVRSDENKTYMHNGGSAGTMADFTLLATPTDAVTSVDGNTGVVTTLQIGTSGTTAMAGNTTFAFSEITSTPTTISGYGITDALSLGTSSTTALAGDTALLELGTSSTTALAGDTALLQLGTSSTTALAGDTALLELGTSSTTALAGNTASFGGSASTVTLGSSAGPQTINIQAETPASGQSQTINVGTGGSAGTTKTINIGTTTASYHTKNINMGNSSSSSGTSSNITMYGTVLMDDATVASTHTIGGTTQTGTITLGRSTQTQTINIGTGSVASSKTKTINIGTGNSSGSTTNINIGPTNTSATRAIDINGNLTVDGTTQFDHMVTFKSDASTSGVYDQIVSFQAKGTSTAWYEAARIATLGAGSAPSRMIIGQDNAALTFFDGFGSRYVYPANSDTGAGTNGVCDLGSYGARFKLGRFSSGTTTSSDRNEKRDIEELTAAELRVAVRCKPLLRKYRRIDAYEEKGEAARIHFGIMAQDLDDAFTAEGLDAHRYAMFMEDTWYEYEGGVVTYPTLEDIPEEHRASATEHTAMGVRYEQLLAFMIAAL